MSVQDVAEWPGARIVIVEDHTLLRQTLVKTLSMEDGIEVAGEAGTVEEAFRVVDRTMPDLVLLDIAIPGGSGLHVAEKLKQTRPGVRVLMLTMHDDDATISRAIGLGADGYLLKTASTEELVQAIHTIASGGSFLSPSIARRVIELATHRAPGLSLTERELEILQLLASGVRPTDVARRLFVSIKTVKNHLTSIYQKLGVQTGAQAVAEAYRRGLVSAAAG